ncbi:RNA recognition motif domain-containing protein [Rhizoctonia solani AG-1 IA]|uniref:RNA recognition motif domain-containing protein n=1 Tax=Thanatephorus cucumeris (strain AG1-IA) TaxID=983506 RepID=L8WSR8_THACA|nr:RNA recognition motif domain-containing protein [Rhizoctonia solani AG-1 IA]
MNEGERREATLNGSHLCFTAGYLCDSSDSNLPTSNLHLPFLIPAWANSTDTTPATAVGGWDTTGNGQAGREPEPEPNTKSNNPAPTPERESRRSRSRSPIRNGTDRRGRYGILEPSDKASGLEIILSIGTIVATQARTCISLVCTPVEKAQVVYDPHTRDSRGFAFVLMHTLEEAEAAITGLNGYVLEGSALRIDKVGCTWDCRTGVNSDCLIRLGAAELARLLRVNTWDPQNILNDHMLRVNTMTIDIEEVATTTSECQAVHPSISRNSNVHLSYYNRGFDRRRWYDEDRYADQLLTLPRKFSGTAALAHVGTAGTTGTMRGITIMKEVVAIIAGGVMTIQDDNAVNLKASGRDSITGSISPGWCEQVRASCRLRIVVCLFCTCPVLIDVMLPPLSQRPCDQDAARAPGPGQLVNLVDFFRPSRPSTIFPSVPIHRGSAYRDEPAPIRPMRPWPRERTLLGAQPMLPRTTRATSATDQSCLRASRVRVELKVSEHGEITRERQVEIGLSKSVCLGSPTN